MVLRLVHHIILIIAIIIFGCIKTSINFIKAKIKFCSSLYYSHDNGQENFKFKVNNKNFNKHI